MLEKKKAKKIRNLVIVSVIASLACLPATYAVELTDINGHWASKNITTLVEQGVVSGYTDGTYRPEGKITKGEFMTLMMKASLPEQDWANTLSYIKHWSAPYVAKAEAERIIEINLINDSNANEPITRKEVVEILGRCDIGLRHTRQEIIALQFSDIANMTDSQKAMLRHAVGTGLISGYTDATFKPDKTLTRAEVASILVRYLGL